MFFRYQIEEAVLPNKLHPHQRCRHGNNVPLRRLVVVEAVGVVVRATGAVSITTPEEGVILTNSRRTLTIEVSNNKVLIAIEEGTIIRVIIEEVIIITTVTEVGIISETVTAAGIISETVTEAGIIMATVTEPETIMETNLEEGITRPTKEPDTMIRVTAEVEINKGIEITNRFNIIKAIILNNTCKIANKISNILGGEIGIMTVQEGRDVAARITIGVIIVK